MFTNSLKYEYTTRVEFSHAIGQHNILLRCRPAREGFQKSVEEDFRIQENFWYQEGQDGFGNRIISGGTSEDHRSLEYSCCGIMEMTTYCIPDANAHPAFLLPSRLTVATESIKQLLPPLTGRMLDDCMAIVHSVHSHMQYAPGTTSVLTPADECMQRRQGVCQDYAHLMISLCRAAGYAARYVCGMMRGEGKTHAWVEVHDGQCWYAFDPTNDTAIATGYIKLAHGRDALDCSVVRGVYRGMCTETSITNVIVNEM